MIAIFTDGSARDNPGRGGWGAVIADDKKVREIGGGEAHTTNNRMELTAAIKALESLEASSKNLEAVIYTDSEYVMRGMTEWIANWQKKGWKTASKKPVENQDLWKALLSASEGKNIEWKVVLGHSGVPANDRCDEIATSFADLSADRQANKIDLYDGPRERYRVSLKA